MSVIRFEIEWINAGENPAIDDSRPLVSCAQVGRDRRPAAQVGAVVDAMVARGLSEVFILAFAAPCAGRIPRAENSPCCWWQSGSGWCPSMPAGWSAPLKCCEYQRSICRKLAIRCSGIVGITD